MLLPTYMVVILSCIFVLIVVTNSCVCLLVYMYTSLRTYTNGFVVSLAVSDILTGALLLPLYIAKPDFPGTGYFVSAILLTGVANVCAVTLDRYLAIKRPFIYYNVMQKHFWKLIVCSWALPIVISVIHFSFGSEATLAERVYKFLLAGIGVIVPYIFVFVAYYQIFQQARIIVNRIRRESSLGWRREDKSGKKTTRKNDVTSETKVAKMFSVIAVSFILSWMPVIYLTSVTAVAGLDTKLDALLAPLWLQQCSLFTIALGSMVNPVIYSFFKPDFRRILKRLLRKCAPKLHEGKRRLIHVSLIVEKLEKGQGGQETDL